MGKTLYWVYDKALAEQYDPTQNTLKALLEQDLLDIVQLRAKDTETIEFIRWAEPIVKLLDEHNIDVIINDYPEIMEELETIGVHVGQDDTTVADIRRDFGKAYLVGATARCTEAALAAQQQGADYLGVGTIFETTTKQGLSAKGPEFIQVIREVSTLPIYAIGGIDSSNAQIVKDAGADGVAVASNLFKSKDPIAEAKKIQEIFA